MYCMRPIRGGVPFNPEDHTRFLDWRIPWEICKIHIRQLIRLEKWGARMGMVLAQV
jgi:hypothetical protein